LNRDYFLYVAGGQGKLSELELPLRLGGKEKAGIVIPGIADDQIVAIIALADGHAYLQPTESAPTIFHNDERLRDSVWLKSGDRVQIADSVLSWEVQGDRVLISVQPHRLDTVQLRPPQQTPVAPPTDSLPVAENDPADNGRKRLRRSVLAFVSLLALIAIYLLTATSVVFNVEPGAAVVKLKGFPPAISFGGSHLVFPGQYQLKISSPGFQSLHTELDINTGPPVNLEYVLSELPGVITIDANPKVDLQLFVDEVETRSIDVGMYEIERGTHMLRVESVRYLPRELEVEVEGFGAAQVFEWILDPAWAVVSIITSPEAAEVVVDKTPVGFTPLHAEILQGRREIRLQKPGFKPVTLFRSVEVGQDFSLDEIQLQPVDGKLTVRSSPAGASILIGEKFLGVTPQTLELAAETEHTLRLSKTGYTNVGKEFQLEPDEERVIEITLAAEYGTVFLKVQPAGATLTVNGKQSTKDSGRLRLQTLKNTLLVSKPGYVSQSITVTPQAGVSQDLNISLVTEKQQKVELQEQVTPRLLTTAGGQTLELVKAGSSFHMGASRRDAGRRANESQRLVKLQRPFYLAHKEVTNADFRQFMAKHDSGNIDSASLNGELQPVVNISWDDAARYCNWLSKQQGLPMAYREEGGILLAVNPMTTGYRLPTEAEWAWVARRSGVETEQRYPWKGGFPPKTKSGNYADARIADTLADVVPNYDDGYRGTAPVGSFPAWPQGSPGGFYDLGGNAAEWMHDFYAVYPGESSHLVIDPMGPVTGKHHVIRGASWRHGSITELRLSYRTYSSKQRHDLGFRIARYAG
jgi:formylglycine-generating enzyme required for sulfatase activity